MDKNKDEHRLADALRARGFFYHMDNAGKLVTQTDEEVIAETEGTLFRARVEFGMAIGDLKTKLLGKLGKPVMRVMLALTRLIERFTGGNDGEIR